MEHEPELKNLIDDIINKFLHYIDATILKDFVFNLVEKQYNKGMDEGEINFNRNFIPNYQTVSFVQKYAFDNVKGLTDETKEKLRKEMAQGLMNHEPVSKLKLRIIDVMDTSISRAEMITRTESVRAFNMGHYQAAKDSGIELKKQWSAQPERISHAGNFVPCHICEGLDGQVVPIDSKFKASNGEEYLLPPVHPHCACRVIYIQPHTKLKAEAEFNGKPGKWRTVQGKHIFFADDGTSYGGDGKQIKNPVIPAQTEQSEEVKKKLHSAEKWYHASGHEKTHVAPGEYVTPSKEYAESLGHEHVYEVEKHTDFSHTKPVGNRWATHHIIANSPMKLVRKVK